MYVKKKGCHCPNKLAVPKASGALQYYCVTHAVQSDESWEFLRHVHACYTRHLKLQECRIRCWTYIGKHNLGLGRDVTQYIASFIVDDPYRGPRNVSTDYYNWKSQGFQIQLQRRERRVKRGQHWCLTWMTRVFFAYAILITIIKIGVTFS